MAALVGVALTLAALAEQPPLAKASQVARVLLAAAMVPVAAGHRLQVSVRMQEQTHVTVVLVWRHQSQEPQSPALAGVVVAA